MDSSRMDRRMRTVRGLRAALACLCGVIATGCGASYRVEGVFTRPSLSTYQRMAMYGLEQDIESNLMSDLSRSFASQQLTFVERERVSEIFSEQDRLPERLDAATRDNLRKVASVQGIVFGRYEQGSKANKKGVELVTQTLYVRILDVESGEIVGQAVVHSKNKEDVPSHNLTKRAVSAIRSSLMRHESVKARSMAAPTVRPPKRAPEDEGEQPLMGQP